MHYRLKISGCYSDIESFLEEFGAGGFDSFRTDAPNSEAIDQISFSNAVMRLVRKNNNECIISGLMRKGGLGCDWSALKGMSEKYYSVGFEVRCRSTDSDEVFGCSIRNGSFSNSFLFTGVNELVNVFFTYMCQVNFASAERARILSDKGCFGVYTLIHQKTCMATDSRTKTYNFSLDEGVEFELEYRESSDRTKKTFNVYQRNQIDKSDKITQLLLEFFSSNVSITTLSNMACNKLAQVGRI